MSTLTTWAYFYCLSLNIFVPNWMEYWTSSSLSWLITHPIPDSLVSIVTQMGNLDAYTGFLRAFLVSSLWLDSNRMTLLPPKNHTLTNQLEYEMNRLIYMKMRLRTLSWGSLLIKLWQPTGNDVMGLSKWMQLLLLMSSWNGQDHKLANE